MPPLCDEGPRLVWPLGPAPDARLRRLDAACVRRGVLALQRGSSGTSKSAILSSSTPLSFTHDACTQGVPSATRHASWVQAMATHAAWLAVSWRLLSGHLVLLGVVCLLCLKLSQTVLKGFALLPGPSSRSGQDYYNKHKNHHENSGTIPIVFGEQITWHCQNPSRGSVMVQVPRQISCHNHL